MKDEINRGEVNKVIFVLFILTLMSVAFVGSKCNRYHNEEIDRKNQQIDSLINVTRGTGG